jgi:hypothetical protein
MAIIWHSPQSAQLSRPKENKYIEDDISKHQPRISPVVGIEDVEAPAEELNALN